MAVAADRGNAKRKALQLIMAALQLILTLDISFVWAPGLAQPAQLTKFEKAGPLALALDPVLPCNLKCVSDDDKQ